MKPIIKTEISEGPQGLQKRNVTKTTPWNPLQMANLQEKYKRQTGEIETEYIWRLYLTGGDDVLLDGAESYGFWGAGIFLDHGPQPPNEPHSLTSRVAYWVGGINNMERGNQP